MDYVKRLEQEVAELESERAWLRARPPVVETEPLEDRWRALRWVALAVFLGGLFLGQVLGGMF